MTSIRGEIELGLWCIIQHPTRENVSLLILDLIMTNGGFNNKDQDSAITKRYLQNFYNLDGYLTQTSFSTGSPNNKKSTLFDL